ncbi:MAG TPA: hypothetical protein VMM12_03020 [Longimicrobiales bacterium]|nr:hypothetical protein [Longimicrobiales bacterium]
MLENLSGVYGIDMEELFRAVAARAGASRGNADAIAARVARETLETE